MHKTYHYTDILYLMYREAEDLQQRRHWKKKAYAKPYQCISCKGWQRRRGYTDGKDTVCPDCRKRDLIVSNHLSNMLKKIQIADTH